MILAARTWLAFVRADRKRQKPAVFFGGKYRIVDFTAVQLRNINTYRWHRNAQFQPRS